MRTALTPCLGIPVYYDSGLKYVFADSRGFWRWKWIVVGPHFARLPPEFKKVVLLHEVGHVKLRHHEKRIARLWMLLSPSRFSRYFKEQEHEADEFAASACGRAKVITFYRLQLDYSEARPPIQKTGMDAVMEKVAKVFHPDLQLRIARLSGQGK